MIATGRRNRKNHFFHSGFLKRMRYMETWFLYNCRYSV
jgi:hypothetical protein